MIINFQIRDSQRLDNFNLKHKKADINKYISF